MVSIIKNIEVFKNGGMEIIEYNEHIGKMKFMDIGAIAFYLKCIPWQVDGFSVDKYYKKLEIMNEIINKNGFMDFIMHRFYIIVKKL